MAKDNNKKQYSLEDSTTNNDSQYLGRRAMKVGGTGLALLTGVTACTAPYHRPIDSTDITRRNEMVAREFGTIKDGKIVPAKAQDFINAQLEGLDGARLAPNKVVYGAQRVDAYTPITLNAAEILSLGGVGSTSHGNFKELESQNKTLSEIFKAGKIHQYEAHLTKNNAPVRVFKSYGTMSEADIATLRTNMTDLKKSLDIELTFEERKDLKAKLGGNADYQRALEFNESALSMLNQIATATAHTATHEFQFDVMNDAYTWSGAIIKSLTGFDVYGSKSATITSPVAEGRMTLNDLLDGHTLRQVIDDQSIVVRDYSDDQSLRQVYNDIMANIHDEAKNWDDKSHHKISNRHLANALSIIEEAHERKFLSSEGYQAVVRCVMQDAWRQVQGNYQNAGGVETLRDIGAPLLPVWGTACVVKDFSAAFSTDRFKPRGNVKAAYLETLAKGVEHNMGFSTRKHWAGNNNPAQTRFWIGAGSTIVYSAIGVNLIGAALGGDDNKSSAGSSGSTVGGGETGGPGTGN